jgi:hypothetical protein
MRCPDCGKFVPFSDDVSEVDVSIDDVDGHLIIEGRVVLACSECGMELKELNVDDTLSTEDQFPEREDDLPEHAEYHYELVDSSVDFAESKNCKGCEIVATVCRSIIYNKGDKDTKTEVDAEIEISHFIEEPTSAWEDLT